MYAESISDVIFSISGQDYVKIKMESSIPNLSDNI